MTRDDLQRLIPEVQSRQSELSNVEVKSARSGTPKRLFQSLSAFANHTGGGVILFGLDQETDFKVVGVGDAHRLQEDLTSLASAEMEPGLRPEFTIDEIEGETVVAAEIAEVPGTQKPCYFKPNGLQKGAFIRVGNTNPPMADYEIFGYVSAREQPRFDEETIAHAGLDDLDPVKLDDYLAMLRHTRPSAKYLDLPREELLDRLHIVIRGPRHPVAAPSLLGLGHAIIV